MGYLTALQTVPYLLHGLFISIVIDRTSKRRLLIGADLIRFVTLLFAAVLAAVHDLTIPLLCGIVCFIATLSLIFDAALGALIPQLFDSRQRLIANSRLSITLAGSEVFGPSLAGFLLQILSVTGIMLIDGATYLISALCVLFALPIRAVRSWTSDCASFPDGASASRTRTGDGTRPWCAPWILPMVRDFNMRLSQYRRILASRPQAFWQRAPVRPNT